MPLPLPLLLLLEQEGGGHLGVREEAAGLDEVPDLSSVRSDVRTCMNIRSTMHMLLPFGWVGPNVTMCTGVQPPFSYLPYLEEEPPDA